MVNDGYRWSERWPLVVKTMMFCGDGDEHFDVEIIRGQKLAHPSLYHSFRRHPRGGLELTQVEELAKVINPVVLTQSPDSWSMFEREKLSGNNFNDWFRQLKLVLKVEKKMYVIEQPIPPAPAADSATNVLAEWNAVYDTHNEVACLMLGKDGKPFGAYVLKMKDYVEQLERLSYVLPQDLSVGLILNNLTSDFAGFYKKGLSKKAATPQVMAIQGGRIQKANKKSQKAKGKGKGKGKENSYIPKPKNPKPYAKEHLEKNDAYHHCKEVGHWKRNFLVYLTELIKNKKQVGTASSSGLRGARKLEQGALYLYVGNGVCEQVEAIESYDLVLPNGLVICLDNCHYAPTITGGVVLVSRLVDNGFIQCFTDYGVSVSKNNVLYLMLLQVMDCEALVKRDTPDKLQQRSVKCFNIGYPKETMSYYFYFPPKNKIVVARYAKFFEKNIFYPKVSRRTGELEEIQDEDTSPSETASKIPMKVEEVEEHSLGDLNEPANYKAAMLDSESNKWLDAMNAEMQSMKDNQVWYLVDLPPDCKTIGSKWVDYEEMFSPVADIRAIRILIAITTYYDYEIWQMNIKTTFLNDYLNEDIYMVQPEGEATFILRIKIYRDRSKQLIGLSQSAYMDKILKIYRIDNSKRGYIPTQEKLDLNKTQGASTPGEVKSIQNVPYASAVGSIMYAVRCTRPDVANTKDMFLVYCGNPKAELRVDCYYDAGFKTDRDDTKSQTGYVFVLNGGVVDWKSSKQSTTAMFATEAEYIAASEAVWIRKFISGHGIVPTINEHIKMFCDNSAALHFTNEPGVQKGAKHYQRRHHYVYESIKLGEIKFLKVYTCDNLANLFTKALLKGNLTLHARSMGLRLASSFM
ncbi:retrotransposon protein, putative, ty1-copia subclass [Tanacetum coccineum]